MKSTRTQFHNPHKVPSLFGGRPGSSRDILAEPVSLADMPAPAPIAAISPDQVVTDILVSTLVGIQKSSNPAVAAAAGRYLALLR